MPRDADGLTPRQARFVQEYLADKELNASRAYVAAGFKAKNDTVASVCASTLLATSKISRVVARAMAERAVRVGITQDWIVTNLRAVAERCMQAEPVTNMRGEALEGQFRFDSHGANRALELLGKHLGMFVDRTSLEGPEGGPMAFVLMGGARQEQEALPEGEEQVEDG